MKKKLVVFLVALVIAGTMFGSGMYVGAAVKSGAGSQNDPVVSLSYLEYRLSELENSVSAAQGRGTSSSNRDGNKEENSFTGFEKVTLARGERLMPGEGGVIVLYSGACTAIGKGLVDVTNAKIITESNSIPAYSQMLVPEDTVGVVASEATILFVIRGK